MTQTEMDRASDGGAFAVTLSLAEFRQAAFVGIERMIRAIHRARSEPYGHPSERGGWEVVIHGAIAEAAIAKTLNHYWSDNPHLDYGGDVGSYHVRSTDRSDGHLLLYDRDPDDGFFLLAITTRLPTVLIPGFILARDGKREEWKANGRLRSSGWMVPQSALSPIEELF